MTAYAELAVTTHFSFLRGASHPADCVAKAMELGHSGIGIADRNSVAGVVRAYAALKDAHEQYEREFGRAAKKPFKLVVGARLVFADGTPDIVAYPQNRLGWGGLCRLLTIGNRRSEKGKCTLSLDDLIPFLENLLLIVVPDRADRDFEMLLERLASEASGAVWLAATMHRRGDDRRRLAELMAVAARCDVPLLAVNDVLYDAPEQRDLQDVLTCIRLNTTIETVGRNLEANAERHLKPTDEMIRLFADAPDAIRQTQHVLDRIDFSLGELTYEYPDEPVPPGRTAQAWLEELTWNHAAMRYPGGLPAKVERILQDELALIERLDYARYFLTIHDIVRVAENKGILCQGRGSAANSAVCYVLGITAVDPSEHELLFARFISTERREPPDIDVDFEHERREEVIQHIYERYGRERAGIAATVITYRPRSAIRDVGKTLGLTEDITAKLAGTVWGHFGSGLADKHIVQAGLDPTNPTIRRAIGFAARLLGFPRHLSQHVGGFVLTRGRLDELVPIGNAAMADRTFIEWDKDDIDTLGLMKVDVLALGMLTCIRKAFDLLRTHEGIDYQLADIPNEEADVYAMLCKGDSIGVFQVESRAQINMLPRLRPKTFYDLAIQVAIVRPGPIQGDMVHPYLKRRQNLEEVVYPQPAPPHDPDELKQVLKRTLGVPLFQEQAMRLAMVAAEFTPEEANQLRRAMATFRHVGTIGSFRTKMVERMVERGYERAFAERCFSQIEGFGTYGFPESHAVSFAKLVYISSFIKCRHPAVFACALLNAQPMGFYAPAQIVRDAREHGVDVRPVDINHSEWDNTLERGAQGALAMRLGFRQVESCGEDAMKRLCAARGTMPFSDLETMAARTRLPRLQLRALADADTFRSIGLDRREALWALRRLPDDDPLPLFVAAQARDLGDEPDARLPAMPLSEHVAADYQTLRLSLKAHPMAMLRAGFADEGILTCAATALRSHNAYVKTAGIVLMRQRPGKGNAIFITLEDETGITNVVLWARLLERYRREVMSARLLLVEGQVQRSPEGVIHLMASHVQDRTTALNALLRDDNIEGLVSPTYEPAGHHPRDVRILPKSRDFH